MEDAAELGRWRDRRIAVGPWTPDLLTAGLLLARVVVAVSVAVDIPHFPSATATRFHQIAHSGGVPYRDIAVEYPIGELALIRAVGSWSLGTTRALLAFAAFGADLATFVCIAAGWGREAARRYLLWGAPLLVFIYRRSDPVVVALVVAGILASRRGREGLGGALLSLGVLTKLWPAVLLPALAVSGRARALWASALTFAAGVAGWLMLGGVGGIRQVVGLRGAVGWELESTVGAVVWPLTGQYRYEQGANRTGVVPGWARVAMVGLLVAGLAVVWWRAARASADPAGIPALVAVAMLLVLSPVLSPQYLAWLVPWAAIASLEDRRTASLAIPPVALTGGILALWYLDVQVGRPANQVLMILRNATLLALPVAWFLGEIRGRRAVPTPGS